MNPQLLHGKHVNIQNERSVLIQQYLVLNRLCVYLWGGTTLSQPWYAS